jgi:hypothetical protein
MVVYNVTVKINPDIEKEWVAWQKHEHIPEVLATGLFASHHFFRLLQPGETDGITYVVQYFASTIDDYHHYIEKYAPLLRKKAEEKWGDRFVAFRTVMQTVQ